MGWFLFGAGVVVGWIFGILSTRRGSNGAALGILGTILAFIGLS